MNHITEWLQAYYDGELNDRRAERVAAHLATCAACREELEALASLSDLLQAAPPAADLMPGERFVAQVGLQMARRPTRPLPERALLTGWMLAPALLLALWAIVRAGGLVADTVLILLSLGIGTEVLGPLAANPSLPWAEVLPEIPGVGLNLQLSLLLLLSLTTWSWLTSWWARSRNHQRVDQLEV